MRCTLLIIKMSDDLLPLEPTLKTLRSSDDSITEENEGESSESLIIDTRTIKTP